MFIIELNYTAELSEIDAAMRAHMTYLNRYYASGHFVVSGRKVPRDGGIIIAYADSREQIEAIAQADPFVQRGLASVRIVEFNDSQRAKDFPARQTQT